MNWKFIVTKSKVAHVQRCPRAAYFSLKHPELASPISESQQAIIEKGNEIGILARQLFPGGKDLTQGNKVYGADLLHDTRLALTNENITLYEAAFLSKGGMYCQADIIVKEGNNIKLYEVKSATSRKEEHILDVGIQHYIISKYGYKVEPHVIYVNREYERGDSLDLKEFFLIDDVSMHVDDEHSNLMNTLVKLKQIQALKSTPPARVGEKCFKPTECPFKEHCWKENVSENSVFTIGGIRKKKAEEIYHSGLQHLNEIKTFRQLTKSQAVQVRAFQTGIPHVNREYLQSRVKDYDLTKLHYVMDFESVLYTPPRFPHGRAYDHTCFQFSILRGTYANYERIEYLAAPGTDCRLEFITNLIKALGDTGKIYVYNQAFEKTRMTELGNLFSLQEPILRILDRIVDVMEFFRSNHVYFPEQKGSYSLKTILPILVPEMSYKDMAINNGSKAMSAYEKMGDLSLQEQIVVRQQLLDYCFMDVAALPEIIKSIFNL